MSVGQFGEGLKMVAAATLRNGIEVEYRSRNWKSSPFIKSEIIDNHKINRLCFEVIENGDNLEGSRTEFTKLNDDFIREIFEIPNKVLALNKIYKELHNEIDNVKGNFPDANMYNPLTINYEIPFQYSFNQGPSINKSNKYKSRIIDLGTDSTSIFVKGVKVQDSNSLFSYDLGLENVSPDRIFADHEKILDEIESLLKGCSNTEVIENVLKKAQEEPYGYCSELEAFRNRKKPTNGYGDNIYMDTIRKYTRSIKPIKNMHFKNDTENLWAKTFIKMFGDNAVVASKDVNVNTDNELMGYNPVKLNDDIANYLCVNGISSADDTENKHEYKWIDKEKLTEPELDMLSNVDDINDFFGWVTNIPVRVYSGLFNQAGREIKTSQAGFIQDTDGTRYLGVRRDLLVNEIDFVNQYIHEIGHNETNATDSDRKFTQFFVGTLAELYIKSK